MKRADIQFLSPPQSVSMSDEWFSVVSKDHFWLRRRFDVFKKFAGDRLTAGKPLSLCEVGCGSGVLQTQVEEWLGQGMDGFDLNQGPLEKNESKSSRLFYYDIRDCDQQFRASYDALIIFDILEHIREDVDFLRILPFYLSDRGMIFLNVPALNGLYSKYDEAVGHVRRYAPRDLYRVVEEAGLRVLGWTFWGLPLLPMLLLRTLALRFRDGGADTIAFGMDRRNALVNQLLYLLSSLEGIPQQVLGTSIMAVIAPK